MHHTPGPWWPVKNSVGSWGVKTYRDHSDMTPAEEAEICWPSGASICMSIGDHTERRTSGNEEANARLIAAAPELLEVVQAMATFNGRNNNTHLKEMARAAIAKATGGES